MNKILIMECGGAVLGVAGAVANRLAFLLVDTAIDEVNWLVLFRERYRVLQEYERS